VTVFQSIGVYCYSFTPYIIASIFCGFLPFQIAHWILILAAGVCQIGSLFTNFWEDFKQQLTPKLRMIAIAVMVCVQITLLFVFKFYFYPQ